MTVFDDLDLKPELERRKERLIEVLAYNVAEIYARGLARVAGYLATGGMSPAQWNALLMVRYVGKEQGLSQRHLAELLIVSGGNITGLVDRLARQGLVERCARPGDRRVRIIRTTRRGGELIEKLWPGYLATLEEFARPLSAAEKQQAAALLEKWRQGLRATDRRERAGAAATLRGSSGRGRQA
jgi:DNA-binding MarR family transcriptional regulator